MNRKYFIRNATIVNEGHSFRGSLLIGEGKIQGLYADDLQPPREAMEGADVIDGSGLLLLPGVIDTHVHFREPGLTHKGTWHSESCAAVAGGTTSVADMPNTLPQTTTLSALREKYDTAAQTSVANYGCYLGATADNLDVVARLATGDAFAVKLFVGASTGNMLLDGAALLEKLFAECSLPIVAHCESEAIIRQNTERYKSRYGEHIPFAMHPRIRSEEACYAATQGVVALAHKYGSRLHVAHVSTKRELEFFTDSSAKVTAETCPHYLWFCDDHYAARGALLKCNPAVKSAADREALRLAVASGQLSTIATDHAPHTLPEKQGSYLNAPSGLPLIQHSLVAMLELVQRGILPVEALVERMCHAPARIFGIAGRGFIRVGYAADVVLVKPCAPWRATDANTLHKCGWSAFSEQTFSHTVTHTFVNGLLAYENGEVNKKVRGTPLTFSR